MSIPGGQIINTAYYDSLIDRIKSCGTCEDIQSALDDATSGVTDQVSALTEKLAVLQPYLALLSMPGANPGAIVTYLQDLANALIKPYVDAAIQVPLQIAELATLPAKFVAAAEEAKNRIPSCTINFAQPAVTKINVQALQANGVE